MINPNCLSYTIKKLEEKEEEKRKEEEELPTAMEYFWQRFGQLSVVMVVESTNIMNKSLNCHILAVPLLIKS